MRRSPFSPKIARLTDSVCERLNTYAIAAGAAGVGVLGVATRARAEIVYTPANLRIQGQLQVDLDHNGVVDFVLWHTNSCNGTTCASQLLVYPNPINPMGNRFAATAHGGFKSALALTPGTKIGFQDGPALAVPFRKCAQANYQRSHAECMVNADLTL